MNENEILDNINVEDIDAQIKSEEVLSDVEENIIEDTPEVIEQSLDENLDSELLKVEEELEDIENLEDDTTFNEDKNDLVEEIAEEEETSQNEPLQEDISQELDPLDQLIDGGETTIVEELITDEENQEEIVEDSDVEEETQEEVILQEQLEETDSNAISDENLITSDVNSVKIEFGIEAKGFILSVNMMEAMIQKGYIFKDMLNDKVFDAVMIFNDNLENTIMTNDIKIKVEDGKIQLIKG